MDAYLEHSRVWYFRNNGEERIYLSSADWMERNLHRRIETAFPIYSPELKRQIIDVLNIQLVDNQSAVWIDEYLQNIPKHDNNPPITAQKTTYEYFKRLSESWMVWDPPWNALNGRISS